MTKIDDEIQDAIRLFENIIEVANVSNVKQKAREFVTQLRPFLNSLAVKLYDVKTNTVHGTNFQAKKEAINHLDSTLHKLYDALSDSVGHSVRDEDQYLRLMLLYYPRLKKIREIVKNKLKIIVFKNLEYFPYYTDVTLIDYYTKIIDAFRANNDQEKITDKFYIEQQKPIIINGNEIYELTLTSVADISNKFSRITAYSHEYIPFRYLLSLTYCRHKVALYNQTIKVNEILRWEISIRPCELNRFFWLLCYDIDVQRSHREYQNLMKYMKDNAVNILDIVTLPKCEYNTCQNILRSNADNHKLTIGLEMCRQKIINKDIIAPVLRYLLYTMRYSIIQDQCMDSLNKNDAMKSSHFSKKVYPFCLFPFAMDLKNHRTSVNTLYNCLDNINEDEKLYRYLKDNTEENGILFTKKQDVDARFQSPDELINSFNSKNSKYPGRHIKKWKNYYYISGYEKDTYDIIEKVKQLSEDNSKINDFFIDKSFSNSISSLSDDKLEVLKTINETNKVYIIQGSAGTGKTTLITKIADYFSNNSILFLAQTHTAVNNLQWKIGNKNCHYHFQTIKQFIANSGEYDVLIIDECSTVNNKDFLKILNNKRFKVLVLAGDPFQIESIDFGNWFSLLKSFVNPNCYFELTGNFRTDEQDLKILWANVRKQTLEGKNDTKDTDIEEGNKYQQVLITRKFSREFGPEIFKVEENQIILTLNYNGLYGINNLNHMLQSANENKAVFWNNQEYRINDPILFSDVGRFGPEIFNNLKGKIADFQIDKDESSISFDIIIDQHIPGFGKQKGYSIVENDNDEKTTIRFTVTKAKESSYDAGDDPNSTVPFQIAYAISIHKAQGLEFEKVKIIVTDDICESFTMNIFYTAITRAKKNLTIYWSQNTERKILDNLKYKSQADDYCILANLHPELVSKDGH